MGTVAPGHRGIRALPRQAPRDGERPNFETPNTPNTTFGNVIYGKITGDNGARMMEVAMRIFF